MARILAAFLALASAVHGAEADGSAVFTAELVRGAPPLSIATKNVVTTDLGDFFQLVVTDSTGRRVWAGPREADPANPLVFGAWHFGVSLPECVADIDGDGRIELVAPAPQSDVSPTSFRVLRWTGSAFEPVRTSTLKEAPPGSGRYPWSPDGGIPGRWVSRFAGAGAGRITAEITQYGDGPLLTGTAVLKPVAGGYQLVTWSKPIAAAEAEPEGAETAPKVRYLCQIGPEDLRSSSGARLRTVREVLRQDRANVHRFRIRHRRDLDDETYFATPAHREEFERASIDCAPELAARIVAGGVTVGVRVYADRITVRQPDDGGEY